MPDLWRWGVQEMRTNPLWQRQMTPEETLYLGRVLLSVGIGFLPGVGDVYDAASGAIGYDLITGEKLALWERGLALAPFVGVGVGVLAAFLADAGRVAGRVDDVGDIARTAGRLDELEDAEDLVRAAERVDDLEVRRALDIWNNPNAGRLETEWAARKLLEAGEQGPWQGGLPAVQYVDDAVGVVRYVDDAGVVRYVDDAEDTARILDRTYYFGKMTDEEVEFLRRLSQENDCAFIVTGSKAETTIGRQNRNLAQELAKERRSTEEIFARTGVPKWRGKPPTGSKELDYFTPPGQGGLPRRARRALHRQYDTVSEAVKLDNWARYRRTPGGIVFDRGRVYRNYLETWQYWGVLSP